MKRKEMVLRKLKDKKWHSTNEMIKVYYKFSARIYDLEKEGFHIERRVNANNPNQRDYRLV